MSVIKFGAWQDLSGNEVANSTEPIGDVGLVLVKSQAMGSGVSSITVTDAFSSAFDSYRIQVGGAQGSVAGDFRLLLGGTTTGYYGSYFYDSYTGSNTGTARISNGAWSWLCGIASASGEQFVSIDIHAPNLAARTTWLGNWYGNGYSGWLSFTVANSTQYTDFTIYPGAGTITGGTIRVYGYRN